MIPFSILDLAPIRQGGDAAQAFRNSLDLAQHAEKWGYKRFWLAEHHNMTGIASAATSVVIGHVAGGTKTIRVGSGGIMLPNHPPLRVAEMFQTLEALYPGRIDLGIGRAPGGVPGVTRALRAGRGELFPQMLNELVARSRGGEAGYPDGVHAEPGGVALPPVWLLGSSGASARMAGEAGSGYSFAAHFSPTPAAPAMLAYREAFKPSEHFKAPHAILGVAVVCAESEDLARERASTMELAWLRIQSGRFLPLPSPAEALAYPYNEYEQAALREWRERTVVGTPQQVRERLLALAAEAHADEVMIVSNLYDHAARLRSYELVAAAMAG